MCGALGTFLGIGIATGSEFLENSIHVLRQEGRGSIPCLAIIGFISNGECWEITARSGKTFPDYAVQLGQDVLTAFVAWNKNELYQMEIDH